MAIPSFGIGLPAPMYGALYLAEVFALNRSVAHFACGGSSTTVGCVAASAIRPQAK